MAGKATTSGIKELEERLQKLADETAHDIAAVALFEGAGVMADAVSQAVHGIATEKFWYAAGGQMRNPSPEEKAILEKADMGVAKFRDDGGSINTSVGMQNSGYAELAGRTVPIPLIANSINSGTSFMRKQPFFREASNKSGAAVNAIERKLREELDKLSLD